jgi:hypothetical protein
MPIAEYQKIIESKRTVEAYKIKTGDRGGNNGAPRKTDASVTYALKPKGGSKFEEHAQAMAAIKAHLVQNKLGPQKNSIPVRLTSDKIEDTFFINRSIFNKMNKAMCISPGGQSTAWRRFDANKPYSKDLVILDQPVERVCDKTCPDWLDNGVKGACTWRANVSLTIDIPGMRRFPLRTVFRTSGWEVIQYMIGSLNAIAAVTGGILANIPLRLTLHEVEGFNAAEKKNRRYPIMAFEFDGTMDELREAAVKENTSRIRLIQSANRVLSDIKSDELIVRSEKPLSGGSDGAVELNEEDVMDFIASSGEEEEAPASGGAASAASTSAKDAMAAKTDDDIDDLDDILMSGVDDGEPASTAVATTAPTNDQIAAMQALETEMNYLASQINMSEAVLTSLLDKHDGDIQSTIRELRVMADGVGQMRDARQKATPPPAPPKAPPKPAAPAMSEDDMDLYASGMESDEPSDEVARLEEEKLEAEKRIAEEQKAKADAEKRRIAEEKANAEKKSDAEQKAAAAVAKMSGGGGSVVTKPIDASSTTEEEESDDWLIP